MPAPGTSLIDPELQRYLQQQQLQSWLANTSRGLMQAATSGMGTGPGLLFGLGSGGAAGSEIDPLQSIKRQAYFSNLSQGLSNIGAIYRGQAPSSGQPQRFGSLDALKAQITLDDLVAQREAREREHKQTFAQDALAAGPRYDPGTGVLWNQSPAAERTPAPLGGPEREDLIRQAYPDAYRAAQVAKLFPEEPEYLAPSVVMGPNGPELIRFPKGRAGAPQPVSGYAPYEKPGETERFEPIYAADGKTIIGQKNLRTGRVVDDPRTPKPDTGGPTEAQMAQNREIDNARQSLAELQRSLPAGTSLSDELNRRMSQYDPLTGLETPDYNSYWGCLGWLAMQSKVGGDPDVGRWTQRLMPISQAPAQVALEDPQAPPTDEGGGFFEGLFNRSDATAAIPGGPGGAGSPIQPRPTSPRSRGDLGPSGRTGASIDTMSLEDLDALVNTRGDSLSPAELQRITARLDALERGSPRSLPR